MAVAKPKNIRLEIRSHIAQSKFPSKSRVRVEAILVRAIRYYRILRNRLSVAPSEKVYGSRAKRSRGRPNLTKQRNFLISELFRAWMIGFAEYPTINNKIDSSSKFVKFCEPIFRREGIGQALDHLEQFRAYRKREMQKSGFKVVRGRVQ